MNKKLTKIGLYGGLVTGVCCFTPLLVWLFAAVGLSAFVAYLDYILLPLLGVFILLLLAGMAGGVKKDK